MTDTDINTLVQACQNGPLKDVEALVEAHVAHVKKALVEAHVAHVKKKTGMSVGEWLNKEGKTSPGDSRTPLQAAAEYQHMDIVEYLVKTFPKVDLIGHTNESGCSSLHFAAANSTKEILGFLIVNYKGNIFDIINQKDNAGYTPLDYARLYDNSEYKKKVSVLINYGGKGGKGELSIEAEKLIQEYQNEFSQGTPTGMCVREGSFGRRAFVDRWSQCEYGKQDGQ